MATNLHIECAKVKLILKTYDKIVEYDMYNYIK
jgi:hypothetical protein